LLVGNCNVWVDDDKLKFLNKPTKLKLTDLLLGFNVNQYSEPICIFYHTSLHQQIGYYKVDEHYVMDVDFL